MTRPRLALEAVVIRPGYAEAISTLMGQFRASGATLPELVDNVRKYGQQSRPKKLVAVWLFQRLKRLEKAGIVRFNLFPFEVVSGLRAGKERTRGRTPSGKWTITEQGIDYVGARLSIQLASDLGNAIISAPDERKHAFQLATPTLLIANCEDMRKDHIGYRLLSEGSTLGFTEPAKATALQVWAMNPRIIPDWKSLQTLRAKHPKESKRPFSAPEWLALKGWKPPVRAAHRKVERHRIIICLEVNPAYWDDLPIERLEMLRKEYVRSHRIRALAWARKRRMERAQNESAAPV